MGQDCSVQGTAWQARLNGSFWCCGDDMAARRWKRRLGLKLRNWARMPPGRWVSYVCALDSCKMWALLEVCHACVGASWEMRLSASATAALQSATRPALCLQRPAHLCHCVSACPGCDQCHPAQEVCCHPQPEAVCLRSVDRGGAGAPGKPLPPHLCCRPLKPRGCLWARSRGGVALY